MFGSRSVGIAKRIYWKLVPSDWRPIELWYRVKCFCWYRYTTIKPRQFDHRWRDRCTLLPYVMFEILSQFIEKECSPGHVNWEATPEHKHARQEMQVLYDWWHNDYLKYADKNYDAWYDHREKHCKDVFETTDDGLVKWNTVWDSPEAEEKDKRLLDIANAVEQSYDDQLIVNLKRMIDIMRFMWT